MWRTTRIAYFSSLFLSKRAPVGLASVHRKCVASKEIHPINNGSGPSSPTFAKTWAKFSNYLNWQGFAAFTCKWEIFTSSASLWKKGSSPSASFFYFLSYFRETIENESSNWVHGDWTSGFSRLLLSHSRVNGWSSFQLVISCFLPDLENALIFP